MLTNPSGSSHHTPTCYSAPNDRQDAPPLYRSQQSLSSVVMVIYNGYRLGAEYVLTALGW